MNELTAPELDQIERRAAARNTRTMATRHRRPGLHQSATIFIRTGASTTSSPTCTSPNTAARRRSRCPPLTSTSSLMLDTTSR